MRNPTALVGYLVAFVATLVAAAFQIAYNRWFGPEPAFLVPFLLPVLLAGWIGRVRCGLFATALTTLAVTYLFTEPEYSLYIAQHADKIKIGVFAAAGVCISLLNHRLHLYRDGVKEHVRSSIHQLGELNKEIDERLKAERELADHREQLFESERRRWLLIENLPQMVWTCTEDGKCDYLSRQWVAYTGIPALLQLGEGWTETIYPDDLPKLLGQWRQSVMNGTDYDIECRIRSATGLYRWFKTRSMLIANSDGTSKWFGTCTDIHDHKVAEEQLRESERRYRMLLEGVPQLVWTCREDGWCDYLSKQWVEYTGIPESAQLGYSWANSVHPDERDTLLAHWQLSVLTGERLDIDFRIRNSMGEYRWFRTRAVQYSEADGYKKWFGTNTDMHEQKLAEARLVELNSHLEQRVVQRTIESRESEQRYQMAAAASGVGVWEWNLQTNEIIWNAQMFQMYHVDPTSNGVVSFEVWSNAVFPEDLHGQIDAMWETIHRKGSNNRAFRIRLPDGRCRYIEAAEQVRLNDAGQSAWLVGTNLDVTERVVAAQALKLSEQRFRRLVEGVADHAIFMLDPEGTVISWNPAAVRMKGYAEDEIIGKHFSVFYTPKAIESGHPWREITFAIANGRYQEEGLRVRKDGSVFWADVTISSLLDDAGKHLGFVKFTHDISARKKAEQALRESEDRFRAAMEASLDGVYFLAAERGNDRSIIDFRFTELNKRGAEMLAGSRNSIIDKRLSELAPILRTGSLFDRYVGVVESGSPFDEEFALSAEDGIRGTWIRHQVVRLGDGVAVTTQDITARKRAEAQVRASLREKELLLKEIHHRVKNNLQIISSLLHLQSVRLPDNSVREMFEESRGRVKSMALIHERLYRSANLAGVDLREYVLQLAGELYRAYKVSRDKFELELEVSIAPLPLDTAIPCGLLLNELLSNCLKHAFKGKTEGTINVTFSRDTDDNVVLRVTDDGCGFPPGFDIQKTTSFGMQLVGTLAEQLDGQTCLESGSGAAISVVFPVPMEAMP